MPGGQPSSPPSFLLSFEAELEVGFLEDRSTGWLLLFKGDDGGLLSSLFTRLPLLDEEELGDLWRSELLTEAAAAAEAAAEAAAKLRKAELCKNVLAVV